MLSLVALRYKGHSCIMGSTGCLNFYRSVNNEMENKNCLNFTYEQLTTVALARGITAAVCCGILFVVLIALLILAVVNCQRVCGTVVKRLAIGLTAFNVLYQLTLALNLQHYYNPGFENFCEADGFFDQYLGGVQLLFTLAISLVLFFKVAAVASSWERFDACYKKVKMCTLTCCSKEINKAEIALFASVFIIPLLFDWIPFTTHSYGPSGVVCWIRSLDNDCNKEKAGFWEQVWLGGVPFGLVTLITLGLFVTSICLLSCASKNIKALAKMGITDSFFSLTCLSFVLLLSPLQMIAYFIYFRFGFWAILNSVSIPLIGILIPITVLIVIHLPLSSMIVYACCKHQKRSGHRECDQDVEQATLHGSSNWSLLHQPSQTTWSSPHSSNDSENLSLVRDKKPQNYGTASI